MGILHQAVEPLAAQVALDLAAGAARAHAEPAEPHPGPAQRHLVGRRAFGGGAPRRLQSAGIQ